MAMNIALITVIAEIVSALLIQTEASPGWRWQKHWHRHRSETEGGCSPGRCVQSWNCPDNAISTQPSGSCTYWRHGPWVCCHLSHNDNIDKPKVTYNSPTKPPNNPANTSKWYSKRTVRSSWRQNVASTSTENYFSDYNDPWMRNDWNKNGRKRPTPISSLGDITINSWEKRSTSSSWNKPTKVATSDVWKKTTGATWNKRTTSNQHITKRVYGNKPSTSESRIIFPTERPLWEPKTTKLPVVTPYSWKKTTKTFDISTKTWVTPMRSTKTPWGATTLRPGRTTFKAIRPSITRSTKIADTNRSNSSETRNPGWGKTTPEYSGRDRNTQPSVNATRFAGLPTRRSTTTRYRVTTPLPNVNTYSCGIRDQHPPTDRGSRSHNNFNTDAVVYTGPNNTRGRESSQKIVGGEEAEPFSWPWVAALYKMSSPGANRFLSAGSLINEIFVLTAAHVFTRDDLKSVSYVVMLGTHDAGESVAQYMVSNVLQHPDYEQRYYYNDIALLRLERPVTFNDYVMPVCLPSPNAPLLRDEDLEGKNVTVMGWGDDSFGGKSSRVLKEATFSIVSRRACNASYVQVASNRFPRGITDNMLCAGDPDGGKDACQGDSGGPLTSVEQGRYTQVGIVSFGYQCGDKEFPGVYTKVAPYLSWIAENTQRVRDYNYDYDYRG